MFINGTLCLLPRGNHYSLSMSLGYPAPELKWYKDDMEMDRYCGLPKYEIRRNGKTHTLHIYKYVTQPCKNNLTVTSVQIIQNSDFCFLFQILTLSEYL